MCEVCVVSHRREQPTPSASVIGCRHIAAHALCRYEDDDLEEDALCGRELVVEEEKR